MQKLINGLIFLGKLLVNRKIKYVFVPDLSIEKEYYPAIIAGVDEAGRGPWAGPVVAAAVIINGEIIDGINDSKKLSFAQRSIFFEFIKKNYSWGVGIVNESAIDEVNILEATFIAMRKAVGNLTIIPDIVLVDGNRNPKLNCNVRTVVKGDSISVSIAAASIIAKVTRDNLMLKLHEHYPQYGWNRNFGYGTRHHQEALEKYGPSPYHRRSFAPVRKFFVNMEIANDKAGEMDQETGWLFKDI